MLEQTPIQPTKVEKTPQQQSQEAAQDLAAFEREHPEKRFQQLPKEEYEKFRQERQEQQALQEKAEEIKKFIGLNSAEIASQKAEKEKNQDLRLARGELKDNVLRELAKQLGDEDMSLYRTNKILSLREKYIALLEKKASAPPPVQGTAPERIPEPPEGESPATVKKGPPASVPETAPETTPPISPEHVPQPEARPETTRSEKELREELSLHERIAAEMKKVVEKGQKANEKLGLTKTEFNEYFPVITAEIIRSYPSELKEVMRRLNLDGKYFLDAFQQRIEIFASEKLPEEIKKRIFERGGIKDFVAFYQTVADKNGKLKTAEIEHVLRGHIADILKIKETGLAGHLKESLRRQQELSKEYMSLRKFQLRQGEINRILGEALSEREREPFKTQERGAYEAAERLAKELPEGIRNKKPDDFFGNFRRGGLQLKKTLRGRLR